MKLRLGTRGSHLARTQATGVVDELARLGHESTLTIIKTAGDRSTATSFGAIGPQGVFVREIELALLEGEVDMAVHSYKDLPTRSPAELIIGAVPARLDPADVLVMTRQAAAEPEQDLPIARGARVGTASARRQAWIRHLRPDISVVPIRGNVPTRIGRLRTDLDGVVLAAAGLERLRRSPLEGITDPVTEDLVLRRLAPEKFVPSPAQGALAIQCRRADSRICELLEALDHAATRQAIAAERELLARVEGGCDLAFGAWCAVDGSWTGRTGDLASSGNARSSLSPATTRLIVWLEHDGVLHKADSRTTNPDTVVNSAWSELKRQWTA